MVKKSQQEHGPEDRLQKLLATSIFETAATLFVASFPPDAPSTRQLRDIRADLVETTGDRLDDPEHMVAVECAILWERSLLAARYWSGEYASAHVSLLRRGEAVRASADPYAAAYAAVSNMMLPGVPG